MVDYKNLKVKPSEMFGNEIAEFFYDIYLVGRYVFDTTTGKWHNSKDITKVYDNLAHAQDAMVSEKAKVFETLNQVIHMDKKIADMKFKNLVEGK